jgi:hypothetical protein
MFLNSHHRETPKNAINQKKRGKTDIRILGDFLGGKTDMDLLQKTLAAKRFPGVFELPLPIIA